MSNPETKLWRSRISSSPANLRFLNSIISLWGERSFELDSWRIQRTLPMELEGSLYLIIEINGLDVGIELETLPLSQEIPPMLTRKEILESWWIRLSSEIALAPVWDHLQRITGGKVLVSMASQLEGRVEAIGIQLTHVSTHQLIAGKIWISEKSWNRLSKYFMTSRPLSPWDLKRVPVIVRWVWGNVLLSNEEYASLEPGDAVCVKPTSDRHRLDLYSDVRVWTGKITDSDRWNCQHLSNIKPIQESTMSHLKHLHVSVTFEVGRFSMSLEELEQLQIGSTLQCPSVSPTRPVMMCVNGVEVGRGDIIEVGDQLAIRLTERHLNFTSNHHSEVVATGESAGLESEMEERNEDHSFEEDLVSSEREIFHIEKTQVIPVESKKNLPAPILRTSANV